MKDENYTCSNYNFNNIYSVLENNKNATNNKDLTIIESNIKENKGETRIS